ncbi:uncharacterized protein LOC114875985 [Osmia bicornis bicornis]|uniref:uncharacterized protein LOC114875985 n=1 Tax=Osmia bicornis bicornis TaxID=1437191 RepID=UPI0010F5A781|nr:uncharacterized protein LOC114875985 [Osmia bicornis bicornis]
MKTKVIILLFAFYFLAEGIRYDDFSDEDSDEEYDQEEPRNFRFNRLNSLRKYLLKDGENRRNVDELENWKGRWMPDRPTDPLPPPKVFGKNYEPEVYRSSHLLHNIPMGQPSATCDDAKTNLTVDWDGSPVNYTCYDKRILPDRRTPALKYTVLVPKNYVAMHKCMNERIEYNDDVPLFGAHRPLWPVYGEYKFLPKQRWLHSLEHGAVVMLYHPCANPLEVKRLKDLVTGCLLRHVITPYNALTEDRPLALLVWRRRLTMSYVNPKLVIQFIREHALQGPENIPRDGDFEEGLLNRARNVSDLDDTNLCPNANGL